MSLDKWEEILKSSLNSHRDSSPSEWSSFESRLENELGVLSDNETPFDRNVKEKLSSFSVSPGKWSEMEQVWMSYLKMRRRYLTSKLAELSIFLLFFMGLWQLPINNELVVQENAIVHHERSKDQLNNIEPAYENLSESIIETNIEPDIIHPTQFIEDPKEGENSELINEEEIINSTIIPLSLVDDSETIEGVEHSIFNSIYADQIQLTSENQNIAMSRQANATVVLIGEDKDEKVYSSISSLDFLDKREFALDYRKQELYIPIATFAHDKKIDPVEDVKISKTFVHVYAAPTMNFVTTPTVDVFGVSGPSGFNEAELGYKAGIKLSKDFSDFSVLGGLEYSRLQYANRNIVRILEETGGQTGETVDFIQQLSPQQFNYDIISVPLELKYYYSKSDITQLYVLAGISLAYVANFNSDLENEIPSFDFNTVIFNSNGQNIMGENFSPDFGSKFFASFRVGIGVENEIDVNNRYFIQPNYQHLIGDGVGYVNDRIGTFGMEIGFKRLL